MRMERNGYLGMMKSQSVSAEESLEQIARLNSKFAEFTKMFCRCL